MKVALKPILGFAISLALFIAAALLMHQEIKAYHFSEVLDAFHSIPATARFIAFFLTLISYGLMTGYDVLGFRFIRKALPYRKIALASFTGYAFSNNIGLSMLAGASVRYRLYSVWGLSSLEIAKVIGLCTLSMWLGFLMLNSMTFMIHPILIASAIHLGSGAIRALGFGMLLPVAGYAILVLKKKNGISFRGREIPVPTPAIALSQVVLGIMDWTLAGIILYLLLSHFAALSLPGFLAVYLAAQMVALFSQVPGGLGVFESMMVLALSSRIPAPHILASLMAFRVIYYWTPLGLAAVLLGFQELIQGKQWAGKVMTLFDRWVSPVIPSVFGITVFIGGAILLFSGATPALKSRLAQLEVLESLPFIEVSHFIGSIAGMGLVLLGRGLQRRLDAAYILSVILLVAGIAASLIKGFDYEEALALGMILAAILPSRKHFYRKASLFSQRFSPGWTAAVLIVLGCSTWLGFYAYRHVEYADSLWWQFTFQGNAARFLRATLGASVLGLFFGLAHLLKPGPPPSRLPDREEQKTIIEPVVRSSKSTTANLALLGDKRIEMNEKKTAFIMFCIEKRSWISMGDPVGPEEEWANLIWRFREQADRAGGWPVFYQVGHERLHLYLDAGFSMVKLGEEARVRLSEFSLDGSSKKGLRNSRNKIEKNGYSLSILDPAQVRERMDELKAVSDDWLSDKNAQEKGFSLGFFHPPYLSLNPMAVVEKEGTIKAFANLWQSSGQRELSVDLMRFSPDAPNGIMDFLFISIMLWGKEKGYEWFNLGMAPFSGLNVSSMAPFWNRLEAFVFNHGENFYNFQGLRQYKEKFNPIWSPRYLASPGGLAMPVIFTHLVSLISGGARGKA